MTDDLRLINVEKEYMAAHLLDDRRGEKGSCGKDRGDVVLAPVARGEGSGKSIARIRHVVVDRQRFNGQVRRVFGCEKPMGLGFFLPNQVQNTGLLAHDCRSIKDI